MAELNSWTSQEVPEDDLAFALNRYWDGLEEYVADRDSMWARDYLQQSAEVGYVPAQTLLGIVALFEGDDGAAVVQWVAPARNRHIPARILIALWSLEGVEAAQAFADALVSIEYDARKSEIHRAAYLSASETARRFGFQEFADATMDDLQTRLKRYGATLT